MRLILSAVILLLTLVIRSQTCEVTVFKNGPTAVFTVKDKNFNNPSGGNDSTSMKIKIQDLGNTKYSFEIIDIELSYLTLLYPPEIIKSISIDFTYNNHKAILNTDTFKLYKLIKNFNDLRYGADTAKFGEYYSMMNNPITLLNSFFTPYIDIVGPYLNRKISDDKWKIMLAGMTDSSIATCSRTIKQMGNRVIAETRTVIDDKETKAYLFQKQIELNGERIKAFTKEEDMIYISTKIKEEAKGIKENKGNTFLINEITIETRKNYGNINDAVNIKTLILQ